MFNAIDFSVQPFKSIKYKLHKLPLRKKGDILEQ